jgi:hypothetical protein
MPKVMIDGATIHGPEADCRIPDGAALIEVREMLELEMKALPEEICGECFPELAE